MTINVLSIDGGGIRGIIPAKVLEELEKRANKPISQIFDLMAGTSTGGIVVAGLCKKDEDGNPQYSASDLVSFYVDHGAHIFNSSFMRQSVISLIDCAKYPCHNIESVLHHYFGDETLENTLNKLLITSYDIKNDTPFFFKNWHEEARNIKLKDVCRAASAAPTYFDPKALRISNVERLLIDGGVYANNPAACAYASTKKCFRDEDICILSIGTGKISVNIADKRRGTIAWLNPLLNVMFASSLEVVNYQLSNILGKNYVRIQPELKLASHKLDNAKTKNVNHLLQEANVVIEKNQEALEMFCHPKLEKKFEEQL